MQNLYRLMTVPTVFPCVVGVNVGVAVAASYVVLLGPLRAAKSTTTYQTQWKINLILSGNSKS